MNVRTIADLGPDERAAFFDRDAGVDAVRDDVRDIVSAVHEEGERADESIAAQAAQAEVDVETAVIEGNVHRSILEYVDEHDVDLIVMGTHGRRGIDRYLLGSATERIVRSSPAPVLTVRAPAE